MITADDIRALFNDLLERITDQDLRERTVQAWMIACREGGWTEAEDLDRMPFSLLTDCGGIGIIAHTRAVTWGALGLAEGQVRAYDKMPYEVDFDRLIAGALLHDVGKLLEIEPDGSGGYRMSHNGRCTRHPISGTVVAAQAGLPLEIQNMIACHSAEGNGRPKVVETVFVHQADFAAFDPFTMRAGLKLIESEE